MYNTYIVTKYDYFKQNKRTRLHQKTILQAMYNFAVFSEQ